ncbi:hypothetical protein DFP72DRAFT_755420, partial [Ephemerocybe angulata]
EKKKKTFKKGVYGFFKDPVIEYIDGRLTHKFDCIRGSACGRPTKFIRRFQDTGDATSTGNMRDHVKKCFSLEALVASDDLTADGVREVSYKNGGELTADAITVAFQRKGGKGRVTYSTRAHTKAESRAEHVRWIAESMRSYSTVADRGYLSNMKTGRPHHYVPSPSTVARDMKYAFGRTRNRVAKILREHPGSLHFATDCWSSPNHRAFAAFTVHLEQNGKPFVLLLDVIELPR